jgi:hypothetical protein
MITSVVSPYGTDSQKVQNMFLFGWYHSGILSVFRCSAYMEGHGMRVDNGLESVEIFCSAQTMLTAQLSRRGTRKAGSVERGVMLE